MLLKNYTLTGLLTFSVFLIFFSYYYVTSNLLPIGAGPDWKSNTDVTAFIYNKGRLAVLPDDEKDLHFTVYGGTRALRPPLSYIVSAATAGVFSFTELKPHILFRKGSALLQALTVALAFYAISLYFLSYQAGFFAALIIGLMPQFVFIASYNNDDSGAIFSATLIITALVRIYRYGIDNTNAVLIGLAAGLIILSKMTAWLLLPFVALFLVFFVRVPRRLLIKYASIAGLLFILSGGWWIAMNVYNYGLNDPVQMKISSSVAAQHRRLPPDAGVGFAAQGIGYYDLLVNNYHNFLGETAKSTIGNLDWLKLRVGPLQYAFYIAILFIGILYYFVNLFRFIFQKICAASLNDEKSSQIIFESLLFLIISFQLFMYTWTNINNDIQIQGKYLIPVFLPVLLLFFSGGFQLLRLTPASFNITPESGPRAQSISTEKPGYFLAGLIVVGFVHWDAWVNYVIPFYKPPAYNIKLGEYKNISLASDLNEKVSNLNVKITASGIRYTSNGNDPQVIFNKNICGKIATTSMLYIEFDSSNSNTLQIFIDEGTGFSERNSYKYSYPQGESALYIPVSANRCNRVRFDPFTNSGTFTLKIFKIATMSIMPKQNN